MLTRSVVVVNGNGRPSGWASLTPTELDVVRLVSEGLPDKDIATLFVSPRTVQTHLTHVYTELTPSNCQYLWIKIFYAASSVAVVSSGRSTSLPFSNFAPARTSATRWGALTARQRDWAASISL